MKKVCELCCECVASVTCESDEAGLCWGCDWKVHGANFLAGKHLRVLLCDVCQAPTPWNASGPRLLPTVAFCQKCVHRNRGRSDQEGCGSSSAAAADTDDEMEYQVVPCLTISSLTGSHTTHN